MENGCTAVFGRQLTKMADKSSFPHVSKSPWQQPWKPKMAWHAAGKARPVDRHDERREKERRKTKLEKKRRKRHERRVLKLRLLRRISSMYIRRLSREELLFLSLGWDWDVRKVLWQCGNAVMRHDRLQSIDVVGNAAEGVSQQVHLVMDAFSSLLAEETKPNTEPAHARDDVIL